MSVFNGGRTLGRSLESVLAGQDVELEVVVVDDGSTDDSGSLLGELASGDPRVRVLSQANAGLTDALIRACGAARGELIARQDADDVSAPGRLKRLAERLEREPGTAFAASW